MEKLFTIYFSTEKKLFLEEKKSNEIWNIFIFDYSFVMTIFTQECNYFMHRKIYRKNKYYLFC